ncbi:e2F/DP family winged-helix DNA-binding domain-containing protein [Ditylenchus destructor]|nr:e2F/DP family winged-helix DNA-binding domain-containing protein [Ditylenchus destructor]
MWPFRDYPIRRSAERATGDASLRLSSHNDDIWRLLCHLRAKNPRRAANAVQGWHPTTEAGQPTEPHKDMLHTFEENRKNFSYNEFVDVCSTDDDGERSNSVETSSLCLNPHIPICDDEENKENIDPLALSVKKDTLTSYVDSDNPNLSATSNTELASSSSPDSLMTKRECAINSAKFDRPVNTTAMPSSINTVKCESDKHEDGDAGEESCGDEDVEPDAGSSQKGAFSRKERSLGLLCKRFLLAMGEEASNGNDVHLESVARKMNVEKRRIYDIVNVMEALEAMSKTNKSFYKWHGLSSLPQLMDTLQKEAMEIDLPSRILKVEQAMCSFTELSPLTRRSSDIVGSLVEGEHMSPLNMSREFKSATDLCLISRDYKQMPNQRNFDDTSNKFDDSQNLGVCDMSCAKPIDNSQIRDRNGKNSLAQLCRRFLMVLLCNPVSLDVASTVLIKDPESEGFEPPSRSRCRRLYDIANVLVAMGLIKKYLVSPSKSRLNMTEFLDRTGLLALNANLARISATNTASSSTTNLGSLSHLSFSMAAGFHYSRQSGSSYSTMSEVDSVKQFLKNKASSTKSGITLNPARKRPFGEVQDVLGVENSAKRANFHTNTSSVHIDENCLELPKPEPRILRQPAYLNIPNCPPLPQLQNQDNFNLLALNLSQHRTNSNALGSNFSLAAATISALHSMQPNQPIVNNENSQEASSTSQLSRHCDSPAYDKENSYDNENQPKRCASKNFNEHGSMSSLKPKVSHSVMSILGVSQAGIQTGQQTTPFLQLDQSQSEDAESELQINVHPNIC